MSATPSTNTLQKPAPWHKHRWPWLLMLGPGVVVVAGFATAYLAYKGQDALVVGDYYKQGKAINQSLKRDRVAAQMGLKMALTYDAATGRLQGKLMAHDAAKPSEFVLRLVHPTLPSKDMDFIVKTDDQGAFSVPLAMLELGHWQVVAEDLPGGWRLGSTWDWPKKRSVDVVADPTLAEIDQ